MPLEGYDVASRGALLKSLVRKVRDAYSPRSPRALFPRTTTATLALYLMPSPPAFFGALELRGGISKSTRVEYRHELAPPAFPPVSSRAD